MHNLTLSVECELIAMTHLTPQVAPKRWFDIVFTVCHTDSAAGVAVAPHDLTVMLNGSLLCAEMAELADARGSGPRTRKGVGVRVPSSAPKFR